MNLPFGISLWMLGAGFLVVAAVGSVMARARALQRSLPKRLRVLDIRVPQGCAVPYRIKDDKLQICLVSLSNQAGWGFPKGTVDAPETVAEAALRESFEEAGVRGHIVGEPLGEYSYVKRDLRLHVTVFLMCVTKAEKRWPERRQREREFFPARKARELLATPEQRQLLDAALARLTRELKAAGQGKGD